MVEKISDQDSEAYFHSRPKTSQIGAVVSPQSSIIPDRDVLEQAKADLEKKHETQPVPRPEHWGGYDVEAQTIEFWQGRESRLHDRVLYTSTENGWVKDRLAP